MAVKDRQVWYFGGGNADGDGTMKDVLGGKGAGLAEMDRIGLPVPAGFTISTGVCAYVTANRGRSEHQPLGSGIAGAGPARHSCRRRGARMATRHRFSVAGVIHPGGVEHASAAPLSGPARTLAPPRRPRHPPAPFAPTWRLGARAQRGATLRACRSRRRP